MLLSKNNLGTVKQKAGIEFPNESQFSLPEKVLQFGTGVLLRALPDFFIEKANRRGLFNGRAVVVKTTSPEDGIFESQDNLYTICTRGIQNGEPVESFMISAAISRVLHASSEWKQVLACAHNPSLSLVISNTTELGIHMSDDRIVDNPPLSFPGKLLAFLYERYKAFQGSITAGLIIIPTELIDDNGQKLEGIVMDLAYRNNLEVEFIEWLEKHNRFCNSLVDRIVPGKPKGNELMSIQEKIGYDDQLLTVCEPFRLWAIEGDDEVKKRIDFAGADPGILITPDIKQYKELKLRLLNGTHTFQCGMAFLSGFNLTREAVGDKVYVDFIRELVFTEIMPAIPYAIDQQLKEEFAVNVLSRFANPFIDHAWLSISAQFSAKMKMRNIPLILEHYKHHQDAPVCMTICFAAYILFMKPMSQRDGHYYGIRNGKEYEIVDASVAWFAETWERCSEKEMVQAVLGNRTIWGVDLSTLNGFSQAVEIALDDIVKHGALAVVKKFIDSRVAT